MGFRSVGFSYLLASHSHRTMNWIMDFAFELHSVVQKSKKIAIQYQFFNQALNSNFELWLFVVNNTFESITWMAFVSPINKVFSSFIARIGEIKWCKYLMLKIVCRWFSREPKKNVFIITSWNARVDSNNKHSGKKLWFFLFEDFLKTLSTNEPFLNPFSSDRCCASFDSKLGH